MITPPKQDGGKVKSTLLDNRPIPSQQLSNNPQTLRLPLPKQQLHTLFNILRTRNELERHCCAVPCAQDAVRVVHAYYSDCLTDGLADRRLISSVRRKTGDGKLTPQCNIA